MNAKSSFKWSADPALLRNPIHLLAFGFGSGLAPRAPGTFGTLVAVTRSAADKRDQAEPQTWLPTVKSLRCDYVTQWISVKYRWGLSVDPVEKAALAKTLGSCKTVKIPVVKRARVTLAPIPAGTSAG